jgi:tetratricopeptide (TPR) repeat protein
MYERIMAGLLIAAATLLGGCSAGKIPVLLKIDTPEYHVSTGNKMLAFNKIDSAFREFNRAIEQDPKLSAAYTGLGLVYAFRNEFEPGLASLREADRLARGKDQEVAVYVGYMRFYTIGRERFDPDWITRVEEAFKRAVLVPGQFPAPYYYMGMAYKAVPQYDEAAKKFYRVMELGKQYAKEAEREYESVEKMK